MKTATELANEFPEQNPRNFEYDAAIRLNDWGVDAAAMLRSQAAEIENLKAEIETRKSYADEQTDFAIKNANERDALKADAERYRWLKQRLLCADFSYGDSSEACNALVFEMPEDMRVSADLDSSIDAMKETS